MNRFIPWLGALVTLFALGAMNGPLRVYIDIPSLILQAVPLLMLLTVFSPGLLLRAVTDLAAPEGAGLAASRYRENAEVFEAFGVLALANGTMLTLIGVVQLLANLSDPAVVPHALAVALLTLFYALILALLVAFPGAAISRRAAERATVLED